MTAEVNVARNDALRVLMPGFVGLTLPSWLDALLREGLGGICLFAHNVDSPAQVRELTAAIHAANPLALVATDEEGGDVSRLHQHVGSPFPGSAVLGRLDDIETTRVVARDVGRQLAEVGIDLTFAPTVDVNSNPHNPVIGVRSFGAEPALVARHAAAWIDGVQSMGVGACAKHFPGHGDTDIDSHLGVPTVVADVATISRRELAPFRAAISAGARIVMTSHIRVPALDPAHVATFSSAMLGALLRSQLGFDGVIVTDALDMAGASGGRGIPAAAVLAIEAGADLLCLGSESGEAVVEAAVDHLVGAGNRDAASSVRLVEAGRRCRHLAGWLAEQREQPRSGASTMASVHDPRRIAATFDVSQRAVELVGPPEQRIRWVSVEPEPNIAIGVSPFGPFHDGGAVASFVVPFDDRSVAENFVDEPGTVTVIVGRDLHRDGAAMHAVRTVANRSTALVVDMGFAVVDAGGDIVVDVATFGASRLVGDALIGLIGGSR